VTCRHAIAFIRLTGVVSTDAALCLFIWRDKNNEDGKNPKMIIFFVVEVVVVVVTKASMASAADTALTDRQSRVAKGL
jgi:ethanolamine utilization protein EutP (predicted NTPase)